VRLLCLGVDHRSAPTAVREALAFDGSTRDNGLAMLRESFSGAEFVLLSTCNRVEVYAAADDEPAIPNVMELTRRITEFHKLPHETVCSHFVAHHDEAVVGHLFRVASSLESLVLGEGQILGQVRDAYLSAQKRGTVGPVLHSMFQHALRVGKKVREETGMDRGKLSVASVAVDVAKEVFDTFSDKTVLVVGAGKMAELTLQHLAGLHPGRILVTNRSAERAAAAAAKWSATAVPFESLNLALIDADVVISTTAAEQPIVTYEQYVRVQRARRNRLALILDIAVPRDFDPKVNDLEQVMLYNIDDLQAQVERNLQGRRKGIDPAQAIIEAETATCLADLRHQKHAGVLLRQLSDNAESIRCRELARLYAAHPDLKGEQREAIAHMAMRLQNQFLHHPRAALRSAAKCEPHVEPPSILAAVKHLFGLGLPAAPSTGDAGEPRSAG
jgi:glutamyl-tRNA reductase